MKPAASLKTLTTVYLSLLLFFALTTGLAYLDLGPWNTITAVLIAAAKMMLVVIFFMEVRHDRPLPRVFVGTGLFWFLILVSLTLSDYWPRNWLPLPSHWPTPR